MTRFYLDTTAQLERWTGDQPTREAFRSCLRDGTHATSSHVRREWRYIVEGGCIDVLNALDGATHDLGSLFARLSQGWGRKAGQRLRVLSLVTGNEQDIDAGAVETRVRALLRYQSRVYFHSQVDDVRDGSECGLAENVVASKGGKLVFVNPSTSRERCQKNDVICRQDSDLENKRDRLRMASDALVASTDANHRRSGRVGHDAVRTARDRKGQNCYRYLGDISIALECGQDEVLLTTDRSFEVMAPALGIQVRRLPQTPGP